MAEPIELNETLNPDINLTESGSENLKGDEKQGREDEDDEMEDLGDEDVRLKGIKVRGVSLSNVRQSVVERQELRASTNLGASSFTNLA